MRVMETEVFTYDELTDSAKESARDWYRKRGLDYEWWDSVYEDAKAVGALMGVEVDEIQFSGFWSQGDGACFDGNYSYAVGGVAAVKAYAPTDEKLHAIAAALQDAQRPEFYGLEARVRQSGNYSHRFCTTIDVTRRDLDDCDASAAAAESLSGALRDFMLWIYNQLESDHDYLTSDESIADSILANEYEFSGAGKVI